MSETLITLNEFDSKISISDSASTFQIYDLASTRKGDVKGVLFTLAMAGGPGLIEVDASFLNLLIRQLDESEALDKMLYRRMAAEIEALKALKQPEKNFDTRGKPPNSCHPYGIDD